MTAVEALKEAISKQVHVRAFVVDQSLLMKSEIEPNEMFEIAALEGEAAQMWTLAQYEEICDDKGSLQAIEVDLMIANSYENEVYKNVLEVVSYWVDHKGYELKDLSEFKWPFAFRAIPFMNVLFETIAINHKIDSKVKLMNKCLSALQKRFKKDFQSSDSEASTSTTSGDPNKDSSLINASTP